MLGRWDLKTNRRSVSVRYRNLRSGVSINCGRVSWDLSQYLDFIVNQGSEGVDVIFCDGDYVGFTLEPVTDRAPIRFRTNYGFVAVPAGA